MTRRSRRSRPERPGPSGFLVVDKPAGVTSHDMVDAARRWLGTRRVGHLGTLDPGATGVLPLAVRDATKLVPFLSEAEKAYRGTIRLGLETDTLDAAGRETARHEGALPGEEEVRRAVAALEGEIEQVPPMYSAVKRGGVPLYKLARRGVEVERPPRRVRVHRFELLGLRGPDLEIEVECSAGTYVRVLAADLGRALGCGAHLLRLRRVRNGPFGEEHALPPERLDEEAAAGTVEARLIPPAEALGFPRAHLTREEAARVRHGGELPAARHAAGRRPGELFAALDPAGDLVAVMELRADRRLKPVRVVKPLATGG